VIEIREAIAEDYDVLVKLEKHISNERLKIKIRDKQILVLLTNNKIIGWLRYSLFWDEHPFMNMLYILEEHRSKGYGTQFVDYWEGKMKEKGYKTFMTSTQANECSQHFYRKLGYNDVGGFIMHNEPLELIMIKEFN